MLEFIAANTLARSAILLAIFGIIVGGALLALVAMSRRASVRSDLRALAKKTLVSAGGDSLIGRQNDAWSRLVDRIESAGLNLADTKSDALREKMVEAGFDSPAAPRIYTLVRLVLVIAMPAAIIGFMFATGSQITYTKLYVVGSIAALAGLYLPALFVRAKADRRQEAIVHGFPDSLDLMLVCVEAGLGLEAALDRVGREMAFTQPLVAHLLTTATLQLRAGASRETALRRMADTAKVDEIRSFATLLIQSDKLGTSIATTLRVYASEMREKRRMRAEEKAHRIPVLISIPLVACMLPTMIGVLMLPAAVRVVRELIPQMAGG